MHTHQLLNLLYWYPTKKVLLLSLKKENKDFQLINLPKNTILEI